MLCAGAPQNMSIAGRFILNNRYSKEAHFVLKHIKINGAYCILLWFYFSLPVSGWSPASWGSRSLLFGKKFRVNNSASCAAACSMHCHVLSEKCILKYLFVSLPRKSWISCNYRIILVGTSLHFFSSAAIIRLKAEFFQWSLFFLQFYTLG